MKQHIRRFYCSKHLLWGLVGLGLVLQLTQYLFNRSLWHDEASLALNLLEKSYAQLLLQPLDDNQAAPPGFLLVEKFFEQRLGGSEYALRLFPLLTGLLALYLFLRIAVVSLDPLAVPLAVGLLAISGKMIYYASELKPYAGDVCWTLLLYRLTLQWLLHQPTITQFMLFGIVGAVAIWFSYPAAFVCAGIWLVLAIVWGRQKAWKHVRKLAVIGMLWCVSFGLSYLTLLRTVSQNPLLQGYWTRLDGFLPFPPQSAADLYWWVKTWFATLGHALEFSRPFPDVVKMLWQPVYAIFSSSGISLYAMLQVFFTGFAWLALYVLVTVLLLAGGNVMHRTHPTCFWLLLSPIGITLLASGFKKYPFADRLILFFMPSLFLLFSAGATDIWRKTRKTSPFVGWALIGVLVLNPISFHFLYPRTRVETRPVVQYLHAHRQPGDLVYVYHASVRTFRYYARMYGLQDQPYLAGTYSSNPQHDFINAIQPLRGHPRIWFVFSDAYHEEELFLAYLDHIGIQREAFQSVGAAVYLYDLRPL